MAASPVESVDWSSALAQTTVADCITSKRAAAGGPGLDFNKSLVDIYAAGASKLGCGVREVKWQRVAEVTG